MESQIWSTIAVGVILWTTLLLLIRRVLPKRSLEFCIRLVATIHGIVAVVLASRSVQDWSCFVCPLASKSSPEQMETLAVTLSYLIYDLVCCQFEEKMTMDNTIHHLVSIIGLGAGLAYGKCGSEIVAALLITEISSPFLHLREFLKELGYRDTNYNLAADISFAVTFSVARMVGGPYITYITLNSAENPLIIKAMALALQLVSTYWFHRIARIVKYKLTKRADSKKEE